MKKHVILIAVIVLVCACAVGLVAFALNSEEPNEGASDAGDVSDIVTDPTDEITEPITDKPTEPVTEPATEAPTEPVTEAPTEPETEPETVPPTQPKVDFTYIARDTMLDGEEVEYYSIDDIYKHFNAADSGKIKTELFSTIISKVNKTNDGDTYHDKNINAAVITSFEEFDQLCRDYYDSAKNNMWNDNYEKYNSYTEMPEYYICNRDFFEDNDLVVFYSEESDLYTNFRKKGTELCVEVGAFVNEEGNGVLTMVESKVLRCFQVKKSTIDGVVTISIYVEKSN